MRKKIFFKFSIFLFMFSMFVPVYAVDTGKGDGGSSSAGTTCESGNIWCISSVGVRLSLYDYDGRTLKYLGSKDYSTCSAAMDYSKVYRVVGAKGKLSYGGNVTFSATTNFANFIANTYVPNHFSSTGGCYNYLGSPINYTDASKGLSKEIEEYYFKNKTKIQIFNKLSTIVTLDQKYKQDINFSRLYMTVEPTAVLGKTGKEAYYGSIYELANNTSSKPYNQTNTRPFLKSQLCAIMISSYDSDERNFIGNIVNQAGSCKDQGLTPKKMEPSNGQGLSNATKKSGYGIAVYWASDYVGINSCSITCSGKSGENLLACAEKYCAANEADDKKNCITSCGYSKKPLSCNTYSTPGSTETYCENERSSSKTTCSYNSFVRAVCTEDTLVKYSDDLPVLTRGGFNYSLKLDGKKSCTYEFDYAMARFEYAACASDTCRTNIKKQIDDFKNKSNNSHQYALDDGDGAILQIHGENHPLSNKDFSVVPDGAETNTGYINLELYKNGSFTSSGWFYRKRTAKTKTTINYILEPKCYSLKTGLVTGKNELNMCNLHEEIKNYAYYGYYIGDEEVGKVETKTVVKKAGSGLNDTNKCYYQVGDPSDLKCEVIKDGSQYKLKTFSRQDENGVDMKYGTSSSSVLKYYYSNTPYDGKITNSKLKELTSDDTVLSGFDKTKYVYVVKINKSNNKEEERLSCHLGVSSTCKTKCDSSDYQCINTYCSTSFDEDGYKSPKACYQDCSSATCPFNCNNTTAINSFCRNDLKREAAGYKDFMACFQDCSCGNNKEKEYLYRPISLADPFPNDREPGSNWKGWNMGDEDTSNDLIKESDMSGTPMYVVEIDGADDLRAIRAMTTSKSDYLKYEGRYTNSQFVSRYLDQLGSDILTCRRGTGGGCSE